MAHLNYPPPCCQGAWMNQCGCDETRSSNMSLNVAPQGYPMNPMWMGTWHGPPPSAMYPYPVPMGHHHDARSCAHSRAASPSHSVKSRKSTLSRKSRKKYREMQDTDDENDVDDRRSTFSHADKSERRSLGRFVVRERPLRDASSMPREVSRRNTLDRIDRVSVARSRQSVQASSSETDDEQSESPSHKESDIINEDIESEYDANTPAAAEVPGASWECEHCTFVNEPGTRVCSICCKTPSANAKVVKKEAKTKASEVSSAKQLNVPKNSDKLQRNLSSDDYSKDNSETESVLNKLGKLKTAESPVPIPPDIKKGRTSRKISFWPGTKFASFNKK